VIIPVLAIAVLMALVAGGENADSSAGAAESNVAAAKSTAAVSEVGKTKPQGIQVPQGPQPAKLEVRDLVEGTGAEAKVGDEVTVHYVLLLYKNGEEVDSSWERKPFSFKLGSGSVTAGWEQGMGGMKVRGRRELIAPSNLAYGQKGFPPTIAPNEALVSVIDLLAVK
jgi:peptidylprolyl isomerase